MTPSANTQYPVLMSLVRGADRAPPPPDRTPAAWEANVQATRECLSWRGTPDNRERRQAEDGLGATTYADLPAHARAAVVTAHSLLQRGDISEDELTTKMEEVRARFRRA